MQKEAENRVREMQSRARLISKTDPNFPPPPKNFFPEKKSFSPENPFSSILGTTDSDKIIILALLWILWNEKADPKLLLALLYLLL